MSEKPEFSRPFDLRQVSEVPVDLVASEGECAALARRFDLVRIDALSAKLSLARDGDAVDAHGRLSARIVQSCAVSGDDLPVAVDEDIALRFVPASATAADEVELEETELDEIPYEGTAFDLGEAIAQSLALAIDPYAVGPEAEAFREQHDLGEKAPSGPLQEALKGLKRD